MPDYQRFITYINLYQHDEKLKNVGFAKIEKRKEQCRFEIHMKNIGYTGQNCQIYFYVRQEQELECIPVGNVQIINGIGDRRILLNGDNIAGSGRGLEEIAGLVIFLNEQVMLASQWKEGEMLRGMFRIPGQEAAEAAGQGLAEAQESSTSVPQGQPPAQGSSASSPQGQTSAQRPSTSVTQGQPAAQGPSTSGPQGRSASQNQPAPQDVRASVPQGQQSPQDVTAPSSQNQPATQDASAQEPPDSLHVAEAQAACNAPRPWSATWQMMLESYPVLMPFEGEEEICCIRIELKELRLLPRRYWYLGNNSFLLHGFFNYRYLILGQMEEKGMKRWFLGVPGVFQNQEKVMAAIFGFPEFKAEKTAKQKTNQFGYWYRFMDEQD